MEQRNPYKILAQKHQETNTLRGVERVKLKWVKRTQTAEM